MTFNTPTLDEVIETLISNDKLISVLKENGALITKEKLLNEYHPSVVQQMTIESSLKNIQNMQELANLLLINESHIKEKSIWDLTAERFLFNEISLIFDLNNPSDVVFQTIFYTYKYCYVSSFFQNNVEHFMPQYDLDTIKENAAAEAFLDSVLKEFDKIDRMLVETEKYLNYDEIPWKYIVYLTQMLGLEKDLLNFDDSEEELYRELAKNILDIYRVKGTSYSFELFFNFLGINIEIREYFFDRRYYYAKFPEENPETGTSNKYTKDFYLTTINPSFNANPNFSASEVISLRDFSPQENLRDFDELVEKYGIEAVLGYCEYDKNNERYTGRVYKYFKTNYIYYYASALGGKSNLTSKQIGSLAKYLDFLTPIFVMKDIKTVAYTMDDNDNISFDGGGDREYGGLIDGSFAGFQMLDSETWDSSNKLKYLVLNNDNKYIFLDKNGKEVEYSNSLSEENGVDTKKFRQPVGINFINCFTSKYLGFEKGVRYNFGSRVAFYEYSDEDGDIKWRCSAPPYHSIDIKASKTRYEKEVKNSYSLEGKNDSIIVKNKIKNNGNKKKIKYTIDSNGEDINSLVISNDKRVSDLTTCSWKEYLLPYEYISIKEEMAKVSALEYPISLEANAEEILNRFNIVLFTGEEINNPKTEAEKRLKDMYVQPSKLKSMLTLGDFFVKKESGKYNVYRCSYSNDKKWFLGKLFSDGDPNNSIQLSGNYKVEKNFTSALKTFFAICSKGNAEIGTYSHLYRIGGKYYVPKLVYSEVFNEDTTKPSTLVECSDKERGYFEGKFEDVGKSFFDGVIVDYSKVSYLETSTDDNMRYLCFWDRKIGELIYDEYDGKVYRINNYGPKGIEEVKYFGCVEKEEDGYYIKEYDSSWKGYSEEGDEEDFVFYNTTHIINWKELGIYSKEWHRPTKFFTDRLYDSSVNKTDYWEKFDDVLFDIINNENGEKYSLKNRLLRDIWKRSYMSLTENIENEFISVIFDEDIEELTPDEKFTIFYNFIISKKTSNETKRKKLLDILKNVKNNEIYEINVGSKVSGDDLKAVINGTYKNIYDEFYDFSANDWVGKDDLPTNPNEYLNLVEEKGSGGNIAFWIKARSLYSDDEELKNEFDEYYTPYYLLIDLLENKSFSDDDNSDNFLKNYFYDELLSRWRETFISDEKGIDIDSIDRGIFRGMPTIYQKLNGIGGTFACPKTLNSQLINNGSDNFTSVKIPLKSFLIKKNNENIYIGDKTFSGVDITFSITLKDWYSNVRQMFGILLNRDLQGIVNNKDEIDGVIAEAKEEYIKCFTPNIFIPETDVELSPNDKIKNIEGLKYFKDDIDTDYYNGYDYHIYYIANNKKTEISSVEQGAILVFFNGSYADWYDEALDQAYKNSCLKQIYDNAIIEITVKNSDRNRYFTKKKFKNEAEFVNNNAPMVISDIIVSDKLLVDRDNYGNVGFITLKYLKHKFKDNYISVPKSIDWIKIKNGLENEYTSYGSDVGVSVKNQSKKYITDDKLDSKKIETFVNAAKADSDYFVINSETEELVEDPKFTYETTSKGIKIIKTIKSGNKDITNKAKVYHKQKVEFATRSVDEDGNIILKIKNFSLSDIKQIVVAFYLIFLKLLTRILNIEVKVDCFVAIKKFLDKFDEINQNTTILSFVTKIFRLKANKESLFEEAESDGNTCRHTKAKKITVSKQKFSYKISLKRILSLLKNRVRVYTLISVFITKIFWLKAKIESLYEEVKSDGNICVHTKAKNITIFNQLYYKISLARMLNLLKSAIKISTLISAFVTKIFWLKAKILNVPNTATIEKIKRAVHFVFGEIVIRSADVIGEIKRAVHFVFGEIVIRSADVIGEIKRAVHFALKEINISTETIIEKMSRTSSFAIKEVSTKNIISDLKMIVFYSFSKNYNIGITPSFEIENILLKRKTNVSAIEEGINTNLETIEKKISTSALLSNEAIKSIEVVDLEVRNNTPEEP